MNKLHLSILTVLMFLTSCRGVYKIYYPGYQDEKITKPNLRELFKSNLSPSIVLRVPNTNDNATSNSVHSIDAKLFYSNVEKELIKAGLNVRDRGLINTSLMNTQSADYSKVPELMNVDLILEIVDFDMNVPLKTHEVTPIDKETGERLKPNRTKALFQATGAFVEYKVILVKTNEVAGIFKFHYRPCTDGCFLREFRVIQKSYKKPPSKVGQIREYFASSSKMGDFLNASVRDLMAALRE